MVGRGSRRAAFKKICLRATLLRQNSHSPNRPVSAIGLGSVIDKFGAYIVASHKRIVAEIS